MDQAHHQIHPVDHLPSPLAGDGMAPRAERVLARLAEARADRLDGTLLASASTRAEGLPMDVRSETPHSARAFAPQLAEAPQSRSPASVAVTVWWHRVYIYNSII